MHEIFQYINIYESMFLLHLFFRKTFDISYDLLLIKKKNHINIGHILT